MRSYTCSSIGTGESGNIQIDNLNLCPILKTRIRHCIKTIHYALILGIISEFDEYEQTPSTPNALTGTITKLCLPFHNTSTPSIPLNTSSTRIDLSNASPRTGNVLSFLRELDHIIHIIQQILRII